MSEGQMIAVVAAIGPMLGLVIVAAVSDGLDQHRAKRQQKGRR